MLPVFPGRIGIVPTGLLRAPLRSVARTRRYRPSVSLARTIDDIPPGLSQRRSNRRHWPRTGTAASTPSLPRSIRRAPGREAHPGGRVASRMTSASNSAACRHSLRCPRSEPHRATRPFHNARNERAIGPRSTRLNIKLPNAARHHRRHLGHWQAEHPTDARLQKTLIPGRSSVGSPCRAAPQAPAASQPVTAC